MPDEDLYEYDLTPTNSLFPPPEPSTTPLIRFSLLHTACCLVAGLDSTMMETSSLDQKAGIIQDTLETEEILEAKANKTTEAPPEELQETRVVEEKDKKVLSDPSESGSEEDKSKGAKKEVPVEQLDALAKMLASIPRDTSKDIKDPNDNGLWMNGYGKPLEVIDE